MNIDKYNKIFRWALRNCPNKELAEDITQDFYLNMLTCSSYDPTKGSYDKWFNARAHYDIPGLKKRNKYKTHLSREEDNEIEATQEIGIDIVKLRRAIETLEKKDQEYINLYLKHDTTYPKLAAISGIHRVTLSLNINRIIKILQRKLA